MSDEVSKSVVKWKDCSWPVRIGIVGGWLVVLEFVFFFLAGFFAGIGL